MLKTALHWASAQNLKSLGSNTVPVQLRPRAPMKSITCNVGLYVIDRIYGKSWLYLACRTTMKVGPTCDLYVF